jgi:hypothetical protein
MPAESQWLECQRGDPEVALCERLLYCLTRTAEGTSANSLCRTATALLLELLDGTA